MGDAKALAEEIKAAATEHSPFSGDELDRAVASLQQVAEAAGITSVNWAAYRELLVRSSEDIPFAAVAWPLMLQNAFGLVRSSLRTNHTSSGTVQLQHRMLSRGCWEGQTPVRSVHCSIGYCETATGMRLPLLPLTDRQASNPGSY
eukprot:COSAG02_NODE_2325_length_9132_cov_16.589752_4_plen_146_part_00